MYLDEVVVDVPCDWSLQLAVDVMPRLPWPCRADPTLSAFPALTDMFVKGKSKKTTKTARTAGLYISLLSG